MFTGACVHSDFSQNSNYFKKIQAEIDKTEINNNKRRKLMFRPILNRYKVLNASHNHVNIISNGDEILDRIYKDLNKVNRSATQKDFHQSFLSSCLRLIYEENYEKERHRVCQKYNFDCKKQQVLICAPRRMGKTFAVALFAIVFAINVPGTEISIFSPGKRQSVSLMDHIVGFMTKLGEEDRTLRKNEEKLTLRSITGDESKINAYPSAVKTLKGVSGTVIILEEMAQLDPKVLFEVVVPLHQLDRTCFIGISTITDEYNFFSQYLKMKDKNDEPLFGVTYLQLACKACITANKAASCNHNAFMLPAWNSSRKRKAINCIMASQTEMLNREIGGIANALHGKAFSQKLLASFKRLPLYELDDRRDYSQVFIGIDPNACGKNSDFAITSLLRIEGKFVIIGLESFASTSALQNHSLICNHVRNIERLTGMKHALKVFILESNLGLESEHISTMLSENISNYLVLDEGKVGHVGFMTTHGVKDLAVNYVMEKMADQCLRVAENRDFVSVSQGYEKSIALLNDQMRDFAVVVKNDEKLKVNAPKKYYSGKVIGKDDLVVSLLLCCYWSSYFFNSGKYESYQ